MPFKLVQRAMKIAGEKEVGIYKILLHAQATTPERKAEPKRGER